MEYRLYWEALPNELAYLLLDRAGEGRQSSGMT